MTTQREPLRRIRKAFFFVLKLAIATAIVWVIVARNFQAIKEGFATFRYLWLIPAAALYFLHMTVCSYRWYRLIKVLGINLSAGEAFALTMQAYFFSLVVPGGAIGGDLVKIGILNARTPAGAKAEGAFSILMDRIVGMIAMFVTVICVISFSLPVLMKVEIPDLPLTPAMKALGIAAIYLVCLAGIAASMAIFFHRVLFRLPLIRPAAAWCDRLSHGMVTRLTDAADIYWRNPKVLLGSIFGSVLLVHLLLAVVFFFLIAGMEVPAPAVLTVVTAVLLGNLAGLLPLFPGGIGARDLTVISILVAGGLAAGEAKTAQLLYTALLIGFNIFGGVFFLIDPGRSRTVEILRQAGEKSENE